MFGGRVRCMAMAPNGQRTAHSAQPVQPAVSSSALVLRPPSARSDSTWGAHTATHQPQPVQRAASICGRARAGACMAGQGCSAGYCAITRVSSARLSLMTLVRQAGELGLNISR